jgi:hypothetical protein
MASVFAMSGRELDRAEVMLRVRERRMTKRKAAEVLGLGERQLYRLYDAYVRHGPPGLISGLRGRPSNRALPDALREAARSLVRDRYSDFGPLLACEKLAELHDVHVSIETLRKWMIDDGLWTPRLQRDKRVHQPRHRRACLGELVQIDGSDHEWFEDRGPRCTLLVFIDDATSRLMELRFAEAESTFDYFAATRRYLGRHGKPVAFYSDKASIFRVAKQDAAKGPTVTQFARALSELNIDIICANSSQAKGRVERANQTLQDRLVKELRLQDISKMDDGNRYLPTFIEDFNRRFARPPRDDHDSHRPMNPADNIEETFTWQEDRKVTDSLTVHYKRVLYLLEPGPDTTPLRRNQCRVYEHEDGRIVIKHDGRAIPFHPFDKNPHVPQSEVVSNKRLGAVLAFIQQQQDERDQERLASKSLTKRQKQRILDARAAAQAL